MSIEKSFEISNIAKIRNEPYYEIEICSPRLTFYLYLTKEDIMKIHDETIKDEVEQK